MVLPGVPVSGGIEMVLQGVQPCLPCAPVRLKPGIELGQRSGVKLIAAALGVGVRHHQTGITQDPQMLRGAGLAEAQGINQLADDTRALT